MNTNATKKKKMHLANEHMKICLMSLIIRIMLIKVTVRYYYISIRMAKIKKTEQGKGENIEVLQLLSTGDGGDVK